MTYASTLISAHRLRRVVLMSGLAMAAALLARIARCLDPRVCRNCPGCTGGC